MRVQLNNETYRPSFAGGMPMPANPFDPNEANRTAAFMRWGDALEWAGRWAAIELVTYCLRRLGAESGFITSVHESIRTSNAPLMDNWPDEQWIAWLQLQSKSAHPGTRYLASIAPWRQWLSQQQEPMRDAAAERRSPNEERLRALDSIKHLFPTMEQAAERQRQYEATQRAVAADEDRPPDEGDDAADVPSSPARLLAPRAPTGVDPTALDPIEQLRSMLNPGLYGLKAARAEYERAAEAGNTSAMLNLGRLLKDSDPEAARGWLERAAEAGHDNAMFHLGELLEDSDPDSGGGVVWAGRRGR